MSEQVAVNTAETVVGDGAAKVAPIDPNAPKPGERTYDIKFPDGRIEKRGESWLQERAQKSIGLEKRVSDADRYEKALNNFVSKVQDPNQLFELLNHPDLKFDESKQEALLMAALNSKKPKLVESVKRWIYENEVKPSLMDPKDRELLESKKEAESLRAEKAERERAQKEQEEAANIASIKEVYRTALGKSVLASGLPVDDYIVRQVMEKARLYVRAGKHPDFDNCCKLVQADFVTQVKSVLGKGTVDNILTMLDGETPQVINKALMKALDKKDSLPTDPSAPRPARSRKEKERSPAERKKWLRNLERGIIE